MGDAEIYARDGWTCQMPDSLCPDGRAIDPALRFSQEPWQPSIDHIVPLRDGGRDCAGNKRAAHAHCNQAADPEFGSNPDRRRRRYRLSTPISEQLPVAVRERLESMKAAER